MTQNEGGVGKDARIVLRHMERLPSKIDGLATVGLPLVGPAVNDEPQVAYRRPRQRRPVIPIDRDRPLEQSESLENPVLRVWEVNRKPAQIEIVGGEVDRRSRGGSAHFGG